MADLDTADDLDMLEGRGRRGSTTLPSCAAASPISDC